MTDEAPAPPITTGLRLAQVPVRLAGHAMGLMAGDILAMINGRVFQGTVEMLRSRFAERGGKPLALTFQRGAVRFTVLATTAELGIWEGADNPATEDDLGRAFDPEFLQNWVALRSDKGVYDLFPETPGTLALIAPPLWLLQYRLWVPFAAVMAALVAAALVAPWVVLPVWGAVALHVRRSAAMYLRADRAQLDLRPCLVIAAHSEKAAHAAMNRLYPADRYIYSAKPAPIAA